ncbi:MAG TPA: DUF2911 domain-containing protein [Acidobacteriaceae bacterium]|jgi:hypothetical protein|nr:DUF2911 domain-containing protein [Acidobacteriaceae bacterium]
MKCFLIAACCLSLACTAFAQPKTPASPSEQATATIAGKTVTISYSSPGVKGREGHIFSKDGLISHDPHYPVWRAGANSATALHTDADLTLGTLAVPKGDYTLFVDISNPDQWTLIVSKATKEWGLAYDPSKDLGKTPMTMSKPATMVENLRWALTDLGGGKGQLILAWEDHSGSVSVAAH